jgi:hypothetical protein
MATARDKLVADWQHELHAAQDALASSPSRDWLLRMRVRLYRFLLRCYGKALWRTTPIGRRDRSRSVVFDSPEAQLLCGKPAKPPGKIQAVLKSVASAQCPMQPGALHSEECYVAVASESPHAYTVDVFSALKSEGIAVRHAVRDGREVVEVRGSDFHRAQWLLRGYDAYRTACCPRIGQCGNEMVTSFGVALATAPFIGLFASIISQAMRAQNGTVAIVFCSVSVAWILIFTAYRTVEDYWRTALRNVRPRRRCRNVRIDTE